MGKFKIFINGFAGGGRKLYSTSSYPLVRQMTGTAADKASNENISDLSFVEFNKLYSKKYNTTVDPNWLGWFIGFAEGDGYLGINDKIPTFVLTQKESKILYEVRDTLKFGYVKEFDNFSRFIVRDQTSINLLFHLFNGNLHLKHKINQLEEWSVLLNSKNNNKDKLLVVTEPVKLSFNNSWFSGFTDAEGCFNVYISKDSKGISLRFIVDQQYGLSLFNQLKDILDSVACASIYVRKNNNYRFAITNLNKLALVVEYFNVYVLRSKKQFAFEKWKVVYNCVLNKEHKTSKGMENLKELSKLINKDND